MLLLLFIFILLPIADIVLLVRLSAVLTVPLTIAIVILVGLLGVWLARIQGVQTMTRMREELAAGRMPTSEMGESALIFAAAALLVVPGFVTDLAGVFLLIPPTRRLILRCLTSFLRRRVQVSGMTQFYAGPEMRSPGPTMEPGDLRSGGRSVRYVRNEAMTDADRASLE